MTCAKVVVRCRLITTSEDVYGENKCDDPQNTCPRSNNEDYTKCKTICKQNGHAEIQALRFAAENNISTKDAIAEIYGHYHVCQDCAKHLKDAGIKEIRIFITQ